MKRRDLLAGTAATLAMPALAQNKPDKLVYVGDNGPWHWTLVEEVGPAFEKATGIKVDFTLLPVDPWNARLKTELNSGSSGIDIVQWSVGMAGFLANHFDDHEEFAAKIMARDPGWDWNDFLAGSKKAATYDGKMIGIPVPDHDRHHALSKVSDGSGRDHQTAGNVRGAAKAAIALNHPPERYGFGISGRQGPAILGSFSPWLYSAGGDMVDFKTGEILINSPQAVYALEFWTEFVTKYKVVPPEAMTWDFEEIVAGGQNDRYAMVANVRAVRHADQRPETFQIRRQMGLGYGAGQDREIPEQDLGRRSLPWHPEIHQEQGLVAGVHPHGLQQASTCGVR